MSRQLVDRSPDLKRLQDEGYDIEINSSNYLLLRVPYVAARKAVARGTLVSELTLSGDRTAAPGTTSSRLSAKSKAISSCDNHGRELSDLINQRGPIQLGEQLIASCTFSHKPNPTYPDYYEKITTYADILLAYAQAIDPGQGQNLPAYTG